MKPSKIRNRTIHKAPLSLRSKLVSSHLSRQLRETHGHRSLRVVPGDSVSIYRGVYKDITGKVEKIDLRRGVSISGIQDEKTEGKKIDIYIHPSNLQITSLNLDDKWRAKKLKVDATKVKRVSGGDAKSGLALGDTGAESKELAVDESTVDIAEDMDSVPETEDFRYTSYRGEIDDLLQVRLSKDEDEDEDDLLADDTEDDDTDDLLVEDTKEVKGDDDSDTDDLLVEDDEDDDMDDLLIDYTKELKDDNSDTDDLLVEDTKEFEDDDDDTDDLLAEDTKEIKGDDDSDTDDLLAEDDDTDDLLADYTKELKDDNSDTDDLLAEDTKELKDDDNMDDSSADVDDDDNTKEAKS